MNLYAIVLGIIVLTLLVVSLARVSKVKTKADYLVAGRSLPAVVLIFTLLSSWIGSGSLLAGAENAYKHGFPASVAGGRRLGRAAADLLYCSARTEVCSVHDSGSAGGAVQPDGACSRGDRGSLRVYGDNELSAHWRRRYSAPHFSVGDGAAWAGDYRDVRDYFYGDCRDELGCLHGCRDRTAGDGDADGCAARSLRTLRVDGLR